MKRAVRAAAGALALIGAIGAGATCAQDPSSAATSTSMIAQGAAAFRHSCAPCHGAGPGNDGAKVEPAVAALQVKYQGKEPALIEHRTDLPYAALKAIVRNGTGAMAPLRPTEITDQQIAAVAAYLADTASKWIAQGRPGGN
jgi:mono/diheme cytochrome c family protein